MKTLTMDQIADLFNEFAGRTLSDGKPGMDKAYFTDAVCEILHILNKD